MKSSLPLIVLSSLVFGAAFVVDAGRVPESTASESLDSIGSENLVLPYAGSISIHNRAAFEVRNNALTESVNNRGILGVSSGSNGAGIAGIAGNSQMTAANYGGWFEAKGGAGTAVFGEASNINPAMNNYGGYFIAAGGGNETAGVFAIATSTRNIANIGGNFIAHGRSGIGVFGVASNTGNVLNYGGRFRASGKLGIGIEAIGGSDGYAANFLGNVKIRGNVQVLSGTTGDLIVELGEGFDLAEGFDTSGVSDISPGTLLVIDAENPGKLSVSTQPYDKKVAGIVSGAMGLSAGLRLGVDQFDCQVALAGRVYCNVDATVNSVEPGDLLTTSSTPGYAMKVVDFKRAHGAIVGKAMERLMKGKKGQILVLVTLQ